ncbi:MAG: hypothetical protein Q4C25_05105 [Bacillota bacterium]|nr:hypothetical protein [Bacillota bacterium]
MTVFHSEKGKTYNKKKILIWVLIVLGFCAIEFPGIFLVRERVYPFIFGLPFLYGYIFCCWGYMCGVLFYAYKTSWGKTTFFKKNRNQHGENK